jgi:ATP-dependent Lon protease
MSLSWIVNNNYYKGDIVYIFDTISTTYYICTRDHVSKTLFYPSNNKNWISIRQDFVDELIQHGININCFKPPGFENYNNEQPVQEPPVTPVLPVQEYLPVPVQVQETNSFKRKLDKIEMEIEKYNIIKKPKTTLSKREQILLLNADVETKSYLLEKYSDTKKDTSGDYDKSIKWLNTVLKLPFNKKKDFTIDLHNIKNTLDKEIYGNETIKRNILQYFAKKKSNPNSKGEILALCGSAGVGKTKIIRDGLANAINLPFYQINCGGLNDVSVITGHSSTYVGSKPGKIVDILIDSHYSNPIIYIDELDKIADHKKKEIYGIFTHIFDEQQNKEFQDNYIGSLNINLSNVFFVVSFNNSKAIDPILLDRFKIINVPDPCHDDKIEICKKMLIEVKNEIWNENLNISITDENEFFDYLISNYHCNDIGVRQIKKSIYTILENINLDYQLNNSDLGCNISLNTSDINKYLVKNKESKDYLNMYL